MSNSILVLGESGQGKTTSLLPNPDIGIKGLNPKETFLINVKGKPLPVRGWTTQYNYNVTDPKKSNYKVEVDAEKIVKIIKYIGSNMSHIKNVVIDDFQYILTEEYMSKALQAGYDKFNRLGKNAYDILNAGFSLPPEVNFIIFNHSEEENGKTKMKTIGKMLDDKVTPIGLFTYVLSTVVKVRDQGKSQYYFATNMTYDDRGMLITAKTPPGLFKEILIPNDMGYVLEEIEKYNKGE